MEESQETLRQLVWKQQKQKKWCKEVIPMENGSWLMFWSAIICNAACLFYGAYMKDEKTARVLWIAGLILTVLLIVKYSF